MVRFDIAVAAAGTDEDGMAEHWNTGRYAFLALLRFF
jgi:hypothetical protein